LVPFLFRKCTKERRIAYSWLNFFFLYKNRYRNLFLVSHSFRFSPLITSKAQSKTASQMAPIDEFRSYEHYLQARQAVGETAVNSLTPSSVILQNLIDQVRVKLRNLPTILFTLCSYGISIRPVQIKTLHL
jgi:hypothetical protein